MNSFHRPSGRHNVRRLVAISFVIVLSSVGLIAPPVSGDGHRAQPVGMLGPFVINATQVPHLGGYKLSGVSKRSAFSIGPGIGAASGDYTRAKPMIRSQRLDVLLYVLETGLIDHSDDRSIAAASLAWWYADTRRPDGFPVWSNPAQNFSPITPTDPDWAQLPAYSDNSPVGIRVPGVDLDVAEREVANLHALVDLYTGTWTLRLVGNNTVRLESDGRPLPGVPVYYRPPSDELPPPVDDRPPAPPMTTTDSNGEIDVAEVRELWAKWLGQHGGKPERRPTHPDGLVRYVPDMVVVNAPGRHIEWAADGEAARLASAAVEQLQQELVIDNKFPSPITVPTTTTSTTTSTTTTTTTVPPVTTTTIAGGGAESTTTPPGSTTTIATLSTPSTPPASTTTSTSVPSGVVSLPVAGTTTQPTEVGPPAPGGPVEPGTGSPPAQNIAIPVTGPSRVVDWMLRFGDIVILVGVALVVATEFLPQRKKTTAP